MTNLEYARSLSSVDMPVIDRVVRTYIDKTVGHEAPLGDKEIAYEEWCNHEFDREAWERARFEMTLSERDHTGLMNFDHRKKQQKAAEIKRKKVKNQMKKWLDELSNC